MKYNLKRTRLNSWPKILALVAVVAIIGIVGAVGIARHIYNSNLQPLNASVQKTTTIVIPKGASLEDISEILESKKIIKTAWAFNQYVRNKNASEQLIAGQYELSPSQSVPEIVSIITGGKIAASLLTILPGQRLDQIKQTFIKSGYSKSSVEEAFNPSNYTNHPALVDKPSSASLEGYLYPESFHKSIDPGDLVKSSLDEMQERLTQDLRNDIQKQGLSIHEGIILASIVEKEADKDEDRQKIAQVFLKRLNEGSRLESDPTALYGAAIAGKRLSVRYDSKYNTYTHDGLPPGPISNVTGSSLKAVANPANTDYLYFVAGDDGTVYFSRTKAEHESLVNKYCIKRCSGFQ